MSDRPLTQSPIPPQQKRLKFLVRASLSAIALSAIGTLFLAARITLALDRYPQPQATFILDGGKNRLPKAVRFAQEHPNLPIWISGNCSHRPAVKTAFTLARLSKQVHYDLRATDTVTNFTTLVQDFRQLGIRHVYLVTSTYHMDRSKAIAAIVFGSHGIAVTPVALPEINRPNESKSRLIRDSIRSLLWLATQRTGSGFNAHIEHFPGGESCRFQFRKEQAQPPPSPEFSFR